jgi:hypothetical protein
VYDEEAAWGPLVHIAGEDLDARSAVGVDVCGLRLSNGR